MTHRNLIWAFPALLFIAIGCGDDVSKVKIAVGCLDRVSCESVATVDVAHGETVKTVEVDDRTVATAMRIVNTGEVETLTFVARDADGTEVKGAQLDVYVDDQDACRVGYAEVNTAATPYVKTVTVDTATSTVNADCSRYGRVERVSLGIVYHRAVTAQLVDTKYGLYNQSVEIEAGSEAEFINAPTQVTMCLQISEENGDSLMGENGFNPGFAAIFDSQMLQNQDVVAVGTAAVDESLPPALRQQEEIYCVPVWFSADREVNTDRESSVNLEEREETDIQLRLFSYAEFATTPMSFLGKEVWSEQLMTPLASNEATVIYEGIPTERSNTVQFTIDGVRQFLPDADGLNMNIQNLAFAQALDPSGDPIGDEVCLNTFLGDDLELLPNKYGIPEARKTTIVLRFDASSAYADYTGFPGFFRLAHGSQRNTVIRQATETNGVYQVEWEVDDCAYEVGFCFAGIEPCLNAGIEVIVQGNDEPDMQCNADSTITYTVGDEARQNCMVNVSRGEATPIEGMDDATIVLTFLPNRISLAP